MAEPSPHTLSKLQLPARYEGLEALLGSDLVKLLTPPEDSVEALRQICIGAGQAREGALVPCWGSTGAGKTTLSENAAFFLPELVAGTATHQGQITYEALNEVSTKYRQANATAPAKMLLVNIDHREGALPSDEELAAIKRFLRTTGTAAVVLWLETDQLRAKNIAERYIAVSGRPTVELPLHVKGPDRKAWHDIALNTLELCNAVPAAQVSELGINPRDYDVEKYPSIGEFLRALSNDFTKLVAEHQASTRRPVTLIVAFISEATDRGALPSLTHGSEAGLLDSHGLLKSTPDSAIGKTWAAKRGILTQSIFRLDARAYWFPPTAITAILRRAGPPEVVKILEDCGRGMPSPADLNTYLGRTDLGRFLAQVKSAGFEARGKPGEDASDMLKKVASDYGYGAGNDKKLNTALLEPIKEYLVSLGVEVKSAVAEQALSFCANIIPDNQFDLGDRVLCIEYVWRSGDVLSTARRSEAAQYALEKLQNYAVNLGWTSR